MLQHNSMQIEPKLIAFKLLQWILRIIACTWKFSLEGTINQKHAVIAFWHGSMLPVWKFFAKTNSYAVVSMNKDGEILAQLLEKWKYKLIRGSSSKNGSEVIQEMVENANENYLLITPDGPRGPRHICKAGALVIAQRKQIPLYFIQCDILSKKVFTKSWDKFEFPLPFSKIQLKISEEIIINQNSNREEIDILISNFNNIYN